MSEIKILNITFVDDCRSKGECQICNINHTKRRYELNCELNDMGFTLIICKDCYIQSNLSLDVL